MLVQKNLLLKLLYAAVLLQIEFLVLTREVVQMQFFFKKIRTNGWSVIRRHCEAGHKCRQSDLSWKLMTDLNLTFQLSREVDFEWGFKHRPKKTQVLRLPYNENMQRMTIAIISMTENKSQVMKSSDETGGKTRSTETRDHHKSTSITEK